MFESINEPQFTDATGDAQKTPAAERAQHLASSASCARPAATTPPGCWCCPPCTPAASRPGWTRWPPTSATLHDPNLAATVHFYGYWPFSVNIAGGTRYDSNVEQDLVGTSTAVHDTFVARGIPVIIGEWALLSYDYTRPGIIERGEFAEVLRGRRLPRPHPQPHHHALGRRLLPRTATRCSGGTRASTT